VTLAPAATDLVAPTPFRTFVVKLHSRCNLACDYCYLYAGPDQTWRARARAMSRAVLDRTARRIGEHAGRHGLREVHVVLHGGEPLLAGVDMLVYAAGAVRAAVPGETVTDVRVQTNGTLLTEDVLATLLAHRIRVGVSVDGGRAAHDRHRRHADGRGSFDATARGVALLVSAGYRELFAGLLATVDLANDPVDTFRSLAAMGPPVVDFLLPHATWSAPPAGRSADGAATPYGNWLVRVFDDWYGAAAQPTRVRLFEEIIRLALGAPGRTEIIGLAPVDLIVVETDGSLEQVDTLKATFHGAAHTGLTVLTHTFDDALAHPAVRVRQAGAAGLCQTCRDCPLRDICGGGYYPHRYREGSGYANPSVYCADLQRLIGHVVGRVHHDLVTARAGGGEMR
jgi:uncharacterized protein